MTFRLSLLSLASLLYPLLMSNAQNTGAAATNLNHLPLSFEMNRGQSDASVKFLSHGNRYSLFLTDSAAVLVLSKQESHSKLPGHSSAAGDVIRMELEEANTRAAVRGVDELPGKANYFIGNDPAAWHSGISTYGKVRYADVYPGVDLVYYGNQRQLEYDFVVSPNADPRPLGLHFEGAQRLSITERRSKDRGEAWRGRVSEACCISAEGRGSRTGGGPFPAPGCEYGGLCAGKVRSRARA